MYFHFSSHRLLKAKFIKVTDICATKYSMKKFLQKDIGDSVDAP